MLISVCDPSQVFSKVSPWKLKWFGASDNASRSFVMHHFDDESQINLAGKIFDIHGLEHGRILVIIGPDLYLDDSGKVAVNRSMVRSSWAYSALTDEEITQLVKNIYRVLLTRGMEECSIYCCDDRLRQYFLDQG